MPTSDMPTSEQVAEQARRLLLDYDDPSDEAVFDAVNEAMRDTGADTTIRAKWTIDDASTLSEAADKLRRFADGLEQMEADGWQLAQPVKDDYGFVEPVGLRDRVIALVSDTPEG